jgi:Flp pilus assembly protein TadB
MKNNKEQEIFPSIGFIPEMRYFATALAIQKQSGLKLKTKREKCSLYIPVRRLEKKLLP